MARAQKRNLNEGRTPNIAVDWLHGLDPDSREGFEKSWRASTYVLNQLKGIIERELEQLYIDLESDYANPNWALVRADKNGRIIALERIFKLLP